MKKFCLVLLLIIFFTSACAAQPTFTPTPQPPSATPSKTLTPTLTATATRSPTLTPTLTRTPIPEEEREKLYQAYMIMLLVEINANFLKETAQRVNSGELTGFDKVGALIGLATLIDAVEQEKTITDVPSVFASHWKDALDVHEITKTLVAQWFNEEIDSAKILEDVDTHINNISSIMDKLDQDMASKYGFDPAELDQARQEAMQSMNEIFETSTPTAEVEE